MLNRLDDYPIHQTPEPLAHPASSDRNVYDRTWFNGYAPDASYYFGIGMAVYPYRGVQDCAFSVVRPGELQHCFFASRRAPAERTDMSVGPFRMEVIEPMRSVRVVLEDNDSGITCDLLFSARTVPIQEARQVLTTGTRIFMDASRFAQFGRWSGWVKYPGGSFDVDAAVCHGTKDRSWGIRPVGEPETGGAPQTPAGICFVWNPMFWEDHITHAIFFDDQEGMPLVREGLQAPLYDREEDIPWDGYTGLTAVIPDSKTDKAREIYLSNPGLTRKELIDKFIDEAGLTPAGASTYHQNIKNEFGMKGEDDNAQIVHPESLVDHKLTARHRIKYHPNTRLASHADIDLVELDDGVRTMSLEPILKFQMKGLGYGHPEWRHGSWKGDLAIGHDTFDPNQLDNLAPENIHVQQVVKASDGEREGVGVLEQIVIGPYKPAGFKDFLDGAK